MIEIILTAVVTWVLTKKYYTRNEKNKLTKSKLFMTKCYHCGRDFYLGSDEKRVTDTCFDCKSHG